MKHFFTTYLLLAVPLLAQAGESDNFTVRSKYVVDISDAVNSASNLYLEKAVADVNLKGSCDEDRLYEKLKRYFANHAKGELIQDILERKKIPATFIPLKESVYKEWSIWDGFLLGREKAAKSPLALSPMIRMNDVIVGVDKFEHMFGMGFIYFEKFYLKKEDLISVLKNGVFREKTVLGGNMFATGIFSYADLSANFNGMRFWNHILQKRNDVLGKNENIGPYVVCKNKKWAVNPSRPIDFRNYIDASMDESVNCSKFARKSGEEKFRNSLKRLSFVDSKGGAVCPVEPDKLESMNKKYETSDINRYIINTRGTGTVSYFFEIQPAAYTW